MQSSSTNLATTSIILLASSLTRFATFSRRISLALGRGAVQLPAYHGWDFGCHGEERRWGQMAAQGVGSRLCRTSSETVLKGEDSGTEEKRAGGAFEMPRTVRLLAIPLPPSRAAVSRRGAEVRLPIGLHNSKAERVLRASPKSSKLDQRTPTCFARRNISTAAAYAR